MLATALGRGQFVLLTTFRKSGQGVPTPVWYVLAGDDSAYFFTGPETGKAKRIRNNPRVEIAPCSARGKASGPAVAATVRLLGSHEADQANAMIRKKYGFQWSIFGLVARVRGFKEQVYYELRSAPDADRQGEPAQQEGNAA